MPMRYSTSGSVDTPPTRQRVVSKSNKNQDSPLQPSKHINQLPPAQQQRMNDDAAEKAARRKSAHFGDLASSTREDGGGGGGGPRHPGQGQGQGGGGNGKRVVSALAVQKEAAQKKGGRKSLTSVQLAAAPSVSIETRMENFEEWMKMATDNKITATNTWNFALIDYFADMTLLRNDEDQSINFQKASCTLDGCVKIWTSRVDSVATETGKLLSGLAGGGGEAGDGEGEEGDEEEGAQPKASRTTHRSEATLAKSFDVLKIKKFDLEFTVDPLFKKTSADFDEGGAQGLLMNHLGVDGKGRVVFDAGDATIGDDEEELDERDEEMVDISKLRDTMPPISAIEDMVISETLGNFKFSSDPGSIPDFATLVGLKDSWDDQPLASTSADGAAFSATGGEEEDFFGGETFDAGRPSYGGGGGYDDAASNAGDDNVDEADAPFLGYGGAGVGMAGPGEAHAPFDPRRPGGELVMALVGGDADGDGMFDYFDKGFGKNWAGAEHWKLRKVTHKDPAAAPAKVARTAKAPFTIDFFAPSSSTSKIFAAAAKSSITLPAASGSGSTTSKSRRSKKDKEPRRDENLLPDDMHFSSRQLLRLFLKPKFALRMRKNTATVRNAENPDGEIDENFWAQAAADRVDGEMNPGDSDMPIPFESQFFHDDGDADDAYVDEALDADGYPEQSSMQQAGDDDDLWQGTQGQQLKKSRPENVHFAKKAKRVDVKRLKDDIWSGLKVLVPEKPARASDDESDQEEPITPPVSDEPKTFDAIIQNLRQSYPQEKMSEISTSFCFICLLHLANEEGLRIETDRFDGLSGADVGCQGIAEGVEVVGAEEFGRVGRMDEGERTDRIVGELQALKVYKDPEAGRAA